MQQIIYNKLILKKLFLYILLVLFLTSNVYAEIFRCKIYSNLNYVIKVDSGANKDEQVIASLNTETGKFDEDSEIYSKGTHKGEVIEFRGKESKVFKMIVLHYSEIGDPSSFRAIYFEDSMEAYPYLYSIRIETWLEDALIYLYNDFNKNLLEGTCK